jgi:hypothetical protein
MRHNPIVMEPKKVFLPEHIQHPAILDSSIPDESIPDEPVMPGLVDRYYPLSCITTSLELGNVIDICTDPFGTIYVHKNGELIRQISRSFITYEFTNGRLTSTTITGPLTPIQITHLTLPSGEIWDYIDEHTTLLILPNGQNVRLHNGKIVQERSELTDIDPLILKKLQLVIPPKDQEKWYRFMEPRFEEFRLESLAAKVLSGSIKLEEFLLTATQSELETYINQLQFNFYDGWYQAKYIGQALKLFKAHPNRIQSFIESVASSEIKDTLSFVVYVCKILAEYNPNMISLVAEVDWQ